MQITDILAQLGGSESIARELGVSETQAARGVEALAPAVFGGLKKQVQAQPTGAEGLGGLLSRLGGGDLLDNVLAPRPTEVNRGNEVLGQIFGSKDVSRTVAQDAASRTGLSPDVLKKMLPMVAMLVTGYLAKQRAAGAAAPAPGAAPQTRGAGGLGGMLGGLLGGGSRAAAGDAGSSGALGGLAAMFDTDGNGNPLDDILRKVGKTMR